MLVQLSCVFYFHRQDLPIPAVAEKVWNFKVLRHRGRVEQLRVFATDTALVLAHSDIDDKSNEIPAAQALLGQLGLAGHLVTLDALHCQRRHSKPAQMPRST